MTARYLFNVDTVKTISQEITRLLTGVVPNRQIIVSDENIVNVLSFTKQNFNYSSGDIYSRYIIPYSNNNIIDSIINTTIESIVNNVRTEYGMIQNNEKLTVWTRVLGDFNEHGIRSHSGIKLNNKRAPSMLFNMNY
jgi:hypothetical protein